MSRAGHISDQKDNDILIMAWDSVIIANELIMMILRTEF